MRTLLTASAVCAVLASLVSSLVIERHELVTTISQRESVPYGFHPMPAKKKKCGGRPSVSSSFEPHSYSASISMTSTTGSSASGSTISPISLSYTQSYGTDSSTSSFVVATSTSSSQTTISTISSSTSDTVTSTSTDSSISSQATSLTGSTTAESSTMSESSTTSSTTDSSSTSESTTSTTSTTTESSTTSSSATMTATGPCSTITGSYVLQVLPNTGDDTVDGNFAELQSAFGSGYRVSLNANRQNAQQFRFNADCSFATADGSLLAMVGDQANLHYQYFFSSVQDASSAVNVNWEANVCNMNPDNTLACTVMDQSTFQVTPGDPQLEIGNQNYGEELIINLIPVSG
ncbi:putative WSC domain-containing protein [Seiridium cardinale]